MRPLKHISVGGFSMIELMVAMLIGLIGIVIIFQVFEVSEGIKRTTTSGGDAQQNGAVALYVIEHDVRNAGMGFNDTPFAGCNIIGYDSKRAVPDFPPLGETMPLVPVLITAGAAATAPDGLSVFYGSQSLIANATTIGGDMTAATDALTLANPYGFRKGDLILLLEPGSGKNCSIMEVTSMPTTNQVDHVAGFVYTTDSGKTVTARFNKPGGLGVIYGGMGLANVTRVFNLGNLYEPPSPAVPFLPVHNTYAIANKSLTVTSQFVATDPPSAVPPLTNTVADNIVHMRAQYGVDDGVNDGSVTFSATFVAGDGIVDRFIRTTPPWASVIAVRVTLVARSALAEKPTRVGGACDATTDGTEVPPGPDLRPKWFGGTFDLTADPDWKCYRYRVFETTIPLRNWIWRSS
jgi:type IV pilus assembly protein PilW